MGTVAGMASSALGGAPECNAVMPCSGVQITPDSDSPASTPSFVGALLVLTSILLWARTASEIYRMFRLSICHKSAAPYRRFFLLARNPRLDLTEVTETHCLA